jgi:fumarate reductase (CoM/CoB) subunit A
MAVTDAVIERMTTDVLVIGGGVAALRAAIAAREAGAEVVMCAKGIVGRSGNTVVSTADISAYVEGLGVDDDPATFARDTFETGGDLGDERLIAILAERSGTALLDLERLGVHLLRSGDAIDRTRAAGHSRARTYRADSEGRGPNKGLALSVPLAERARQLGVRILDHAPVVQLCAVGGSLAGAVVIDTRAQTVLALSTGAVVAGAGGASYLFSRTNGTVEATGDVIALALRAGAAARDLEFVQWHPTRMDQPISLFLTNGLLADGAVFRDAAGREFMADYDPRANLAPRDVLAKSIYLEVQAGRGVAGGVYLDCSPIPEERIQLRHAYVAELLRKHGVDFPAQRVVVSPAAHFLMGGLVIDEAAASTLPGLYVAGENAGGIHGANRLGGNAFCEGLVFGTIAGRGAAAFARSTGRRDLPADVLDRCLAPLDSAAPDPRPVLMGRWACLRAAMWEHVSLVRDAASLDRADDALDELTVEAAQLAGPTAADAARILELRAALDCARAIVAAARFRTESRGAHWRADYPGRSAAWLGSAFMTWPDGAAQPALDFRPKH